MAGTDYKIVGSLTGFYHQRLVKNLNLTSTEYGLPGMPYVRSSVGQLTNASHIIGSTVHPVVPIRYVGIGTQAQSTKSTGTEGMYVELVKTFDIIEAGYTGTASTDFIAGLRNIKLSTDGSDTSTSGYAPLALSTSTHCGTTAVLEHAIIESVDSSNSKVRFYFERMTT